MNYYNILNVKFNSSTEQITQSFRELAKKYHPDINKSPNAKEMFINIYEAYSILKDPNKRKAYDEILNRTYSKDTSYVHNNNVEKEYSQWEYEAKKEGEYYSEKNYDEFVEKVFNKVLEIGKTTAQVAGGLVIGAALGIVLGFGIAILRLVCYIGPLFELVYLYLALKWDLWREYLPLGIIALIVNISLTIFIHVKLKKYNINSI